SLACRSCTTCLSCLCCCCIPCLTCSPTLYSFFFSSRRRHTRCYRDWSSDVCSSDLIRHSISEYREGGSSSANEIRAAWICTINRNARPTAARMSFLLIISVHVLLFAPFLMAGRPHRG